MSSSRRGSLALLALMFVAALVAIAVWALRDEPREPSAPTRTAPAAPTQPRAAGPVRTPERVAKPRSESAPTVRPKDIAPPAIRDPAAVSLKSAVKVHVIVRRSNGGPAAGADVYALDPLGEHTTPPGPPVRVRKSADDGGRVDFDIAGGTTVLRFLASLDGEAAASDGIDVADGTERTVELDLAPGVTPRIRVVDVNRTVIAGAVVRVERVGGGGTWPLVVQGMTDGAGDAVLPTIPTGDFVWALDVSASAFGFATTRQHVGPAAARDGTVVIELTRAATVRGRCVDEAGAPVVGASVRVAPQDVRGRTDAEGRFSIVGLATEGGSVAVEHRDYAPSVVTDVRPAADVADVGDIVLRPGGPLTGVVTDAEGKPVRGADIQVTNAAALWWRSAATDAEGRFRVEHLADAAHEVVAKEPREAGRDWATLRTATQTGVRAGAEVHLQLTGALSVYVRFLNDSDSSPVVVSSVKLTATPAGAAPDAIAWAWAGSNLDAVRFQPAHAGVFDVTVEIPGYDAGTAKGVDVSADRETRIDVMFRRRAP
ncbi:MAG: carboxypeptidase-like regulatory domain-containing protein [Planctomycetes bacterium]|nr:carboxypeptidase-like regulatory domain-containing protein [Planctomycetota bacterium]